VVLYSTCKALPGILSGFMNRRTYIVSLFLLTVFPLMADTNATQHLIRPDPQITFISVENDQATLSGAVVPTRRLTLVGFQIREAGKKRFRRAAPEWQRDLFISPSSSNVEFSVTATVKEDTRYECRAVAIYRGVRRYGPVQSFHSSAFPPEILSLDIQRMNATTVLLSATINPRGRPAHARFDWNAYNGQVFSTAEQWVGSGTNLVELQTLLTNLVPDTYYSCGVEGWNEFDFNGLSSAFRTARVSSPPGGVEIGRVRHF
jgi:hypothetical protein